MKVLLTVGHKASGFDNIHNALVGAGMANALPAKRENLTPHQLVSKLIAACNAQGGVISQLTPGRLWNELLADLLLTNLEQPIWGWADPELIRLIAWLADYEPEIRFVLVYASPEITLANALGGTMAEEQDIARCLSEWSDFNEELLRFYYRNPQRCVIVNSIVAANEPARLLAQVETQFALALSEQKVPPFALDAVTAVTAVLAKHLLTCRPEILALRQELEAAACIDFDLDLEDAKLMTNAWGSFSQLQADSAQRASELQAKLEDQTRTVAASQNQIAQQAASLRKLEQELEKARADASKVNELAKLKRENAEQAQENELLLLQLHQVQEELECYFLQCQELKGGATQQAGKITYPLSGISLDLRDDLPGENWYHAEVDGRWAGPGLTSTLQLPKLEDGQYQIDLNVVDAMAPEILDTMVLLINEQPIVWERIGEDYPALIRARFTARSAANAPFWTLAFSFKHNISPKDHGSDDDRQLAIRLRSVTLLRCDD